MNSNKYPKMTKSFFADRERIENLEKKYRIALINSISGFKSVNLLGTISKEGVHNLAIFNSVMHIGANPPLLGFIMRPTTVPRHTYQNIEETGYYTINHVHKNIIEKAHQTGAKYQKNESEFDKCGLTPEYIHDFTAPFVRESKIKLGLGLKEVLPVKTNGTFLVVGEILQITFENEDFILENGALDLEAAETVTMTGLDTYFSSNFIKKMPIPRT